MNTSAPADRYKNYRLPMVVFSHGVWLYYWVCPSHLDVEELLFARGVLVSNETIRKWCRKFEQPYAKQLRRRRPRPSNTWHLDEVFLTINGQRHYLWRAVDQDGHVLISWCSAERIRRQPRSSSGSSSRAVGTSHG